MDQTGITQHSAPGVRPPILNRYHIFGTKGHTSCVLFISIEQNLGEWSAMNEQPIAPSTSAGTESKYQHKAAWGAMLAGAALSIYGWTRKSASGVALGVAGGAIALKAASAGPIADLIGSETTMHCSFMIMRNASELYAACKDVERAPQWMEQIDSVMRIDNRRVRWIRRHPGTGTVEWTTEITEDIPNRSLAWRAVPGGGNYDLSGRVELRELGPTRGTEVTFSLTYKLHAGLLQSVAATIIGEDPQGQLRENLLRFKMWIEAGEMRPLAARASLK